MFFFFFRIVLGAKKIPLLSLVTWVGSGGKST